MVTFIDPATGRFRAPSRAEAEALFWSKAERRGVDDCWSWTGALGRGGYGQFRVGGQGFSSGSAHRWSFFFANGRAPVGEARHSCDNPPCVNPTHLIEGTRLENERDKDSRGRRPSGVLGLPCPHCGGPQDGRSKRKSATGGVREFAFCIPCRKAYLAEYYRRRRALTP